MSIQRLSIERMADTGEGIGRWPDGRICFVPGALPGEVVDVAPEQERARWVRANIENVVEASHERVEPDCAVFGRCGGCDWRMLDRDVQCGWRRDLLQQQLEHRGFLVAVEELRPSTGRRSRVQVEHRDGQWGFLARRSKRLVSTASCPAMEPALEAVVAAFAQLRPEYKGRIHWRRDERGAISAICGPADDADRLYSALQEAGASGAVIGRRSFGDPEFQYSVAGVRLVAPPRAFTQVNLAANRELVQTVTGCVGDAEAVLDLYCGIGNFSLPLAAQGKQVIGAEGAAAAVSAARHNARRNGLDQKARFVRIDLQRPAEVSAFLARVAVSTVILDPPRAGARAVSECLSASAVKRVVMVSCDPATALRDLVVLRDGGFTLRAVRPVDMFPGTAHVEVVYLLER